MQNTALGWCALGLALSAQGCSAHVDLTAPTAAAPSRERLEAWEKIKALEMSETHVTYQSGATARYVDYLQLADGRRVYHVEDILPVIDPASPSAKAAQSAIDTQQTADVFSGVGIGLTIAGAAMFIPGGIMVFTADGDPPAEGIGLLVAGGSSLVLGSLSQFVIARLISNSANDEKSTAFVTYNPALLKRLGLCEAPGLTVVPCDTSPGDEPDPGGTASRQHLRGHEDALLPRRGEQVASR